MISLIPVIIPNDPHTNVSIDKAAHHGTDATQK